MLLASLADRYWVHHPHPFIWQFSESFGLRYYGVAYVLGFLVGAWLLSRYTRARRSPLTTDQNGDLMFALVLGVMVGGRLGYYLLYQPAVLLRDPLELFRVWNGGMASHGGFAGVALGLAWFAWRSRTGFWRLADLVATITPPGLLLGRIANFLNGELWGKVVENHVPWAVIFTSSEPPGTPLERILPRHPSQLYEAGLEGLALFVYLQLRFWRSRTAAERPGQITGEFLLGYALARVFCELFREPDAEPIAGLSRGSFYSLFLAAAGLALILWSRRRNAATS